MLDSTNMDKDIAKSELPNIIDKNARSSPHFSNWMLHQNSKHKVTTNLTVSL